MIKLCLSFGGVVVVALLLSLVFRESDSPIYKLIPALVAFIGTWMLLPHLGEAATYARKSIAAVSGELGTIVIKAVFICVAAELIGCACEEISPTIAKCCITFGRLALVICSFPIVRTLIDKACSLI